MWEQNYDHTNLEGRSRELGGISNCRQHTVLIIPLTLNPALKHKLRREHGIKIQSLHIGLLPHGPLARSVRILPPHVIPIINMICQHNYGHSELKVPSPQPRHQDLSLRWRLATLRREKLHQDCTAPPHLLRWHVSRRVLFMCLRFFGASRWTAALAKTCQETTPHFFFLFLFFLFRSCVVSLPEKINSGGGDQITIKVSYIYIYYICT